MTELNEELEYLEPASETDERGNTILMINGKRLVVPVFSKDSITFGMRRKTRNLSEERQSEEIFALFLEQNLTEEELEVWDSLTETELEELKNVGALSESKK